MNNLLLKKPVLMAGFFVFLMSRQTGPQVSDAG